MRIFLSAGEPSGDHHAACLVEAIRARCPRAEFVGFGGPQLERAGCRLLYPLTDLAVMWFLHVGLNLHRFLSLLSQADRYFRHHRPDAVVLVDYPGFNWWIARRAHFHGIRVFYYVPPQIWAWASWRVKKMRRYVDHVLCSLPFESAWYAERGVHAVYVGHPFFDKLSEESGEDRSTPHTPHPTPDLPPCPLAPSLPRLVGLLPGSRRQEVRKNFAIMLRAASLLAQRLPNVRFEVACFSAEHRELAADILTDLAAHNRRLRELELNFCVGETPRIIREAEACLAVSGSVGLELLAAGIPAVVLYKISPFDMWVCKRLMKAKYISLVNLLADDEVIPEYLTDRDCSPELADRLYTWLSDLAEAERIHVRLAELRQTACLPGASQRAADYILERLNDAGTAGTSNARRPPSARTAPRSPHFSLGSATQSLLR